MAERLLNRNTTLSLAVGALLLGLSFSTAQATPAAGMTPRVAASSGIIEGVQFGCMRRCLRSTDLPSWACRRRCFGGAGAREFGGRCVRRCLARTDSSPWACRRRCYGGYGRFDRDRRFGDEW
jgi:hypothetical protein